MASKQGLQILFKGSKFDSLLFDSEGRPDATEREKADSSAMDKLEPIAPELKSGKIIDVKHRFAKKRFDDRYLAKPAPQIETAIQRAIFG